MAMERVKERRFICKTNILILRNENTNERTIWQTAIATATATTITRQRAI